MPAYILTFDLGTTGNKAALVDEGGRILRSHTVPYGVGYPRPGWACQQGRDLAASCAKACRELMESGDVRPADIAVIGLSGTMNGCLAVDWNGEPLYPHIIHADTRSTGQAARMDRTGVDWYRLTGNRASARGTAAKILWLKDCEPSVYRRARWFLQTKDYVRGCLTGGWDCTDPSDGALTGAMDIARREWAWNALAECGIDPDKLPAIRPSDTVAGRLSAGAAREMGLIEGIPVSVGGGDGACAAAGAGLAAAGRGYCCLGSTAWISVLADRVLDGEGRRFVHYIDLSGQHIVPTGTVQAAATCFDWIRSVLGIKDIQTASALAASVPPGAGGLLFAPWIQGERTPLWDEDIRGAFLGLSMEHTAAHMVRAVYEGVACALRSVLAVFSRDGVPNGELVILGGGARSDLWLEILAGVTGHTLLPHRQPESATSLGAAMAAGVAAGLWPDWETAFGITSFSRSVKASPGPDAVYGPLGAAYDLLYGALSPITPLLRGLRERLTAHETAFDGSESPTHSK